jgi:hypothetical protein
MTHGQKAIKLNKEKLSVSGVLLLLLRAEKMCSVPKPIIIISKQTFQVEG